MDVSELTFEEAFHELEETVRKLEEGDLTLEESIALFERGMRLAEYCGEKLDKAELKVKQLISSLKGEVEIAPFEPS